jgi:hypothetical protein
MVETVFLDKIERNKTLSGSRLTSVGAADQRVNILEYIVLLHWRGLGGMNQRATAGEKERQNQML